MKMSVMELQPLIIGFMSEAQSNPQMTAYHTSVYFALVHVALKSGGDHLFSAFSRDVLPFTKLLRPGTYHRIMRELDQFGLIRYTPSRSPLLGSLIELLKIPVL